MLNITFHHTNYHDLLTFYSQKFAAPIVDQTVVFPDDAAIGKIQVITLGERIQCFLSDYTALQPAIVHRKKVDQQYFIVRFDEITEPGPNHTFITKSAASITSTTTDWIFFENAGAQVRSVNVMVDNAQLQQWLQPGEEAELVLNYLNTPGNTPSYEPFDTEYKFLFDPVFQHTYTDTLGSFVVQNRINLLLERFFTRLYKRLSEEHFDTKVSVYDLERLRDIETLLTYDFSKTPPSIADLARKAAMSTSKLKQIFKETYHLPIYQYYQKHRMNRAKAMLISKKYSVKQISDAIGYEDVGSFLKAYKKTFDEQPQLVTA